MDWQDEGFIIGGRRHGETSLILEVMTRSHGRHLGLVRGGRSRRLQPLFQPGNAVVATWRARLEEHLGFFTLETTRLRAADLMIRAIGLHGLNHVAGLLRLLPEREPHEALFQAAAGVLDSLAGPAASADSALAAEMVRLELALLTDSGYGLDLETCAATGVRDDLVWVSPRSGRAVSRAAGEPYAERLFALPLYLRQPIGPGQPGNGAAAPTVADLVAGFALTGYFLERDLFAPRGLVMASSRDALIRDLVAAIGSGTREL